MTKYTEKYERTKFGSMDEFKDLISGFEKAELRPIHVKGIGDFNEFEEYNTLQNMQDFWNERRVAVVNKATNEMAQITSLGYKILQHSNFGAAVADKLELAGVGNAVRGYVLKRDGGNEICMRFLFDEVEIEEPGYGKNIKVGAEFCNSYDSMYAARGRAFYLRISCTNQMLMRNIIPDVIFSKNHVAPSEVKLLETVDSHIDTFIENLLASGAVFKNRIQEAIKKEIEFQQEEQVRIILEKIVGKSRSVDVAEKAMQETRRWQGKYRINSWELYNSVTSYATHTAMSPKKFDQILLKAENLLTEPIKVPAIPKPQ